MRACVLIPHYDHLVQFQALLPRLVDTGLPLLIIDDASPEPIYQDLLALLRSEVADIELRRHQENKGKGGAVMTGLRTAIELGFTHAIQIDADGQHDLDGLSALIKESENFPDALVCGAPQFDGSISGFRKYGRKVSHILCRLEALSCDIVDALCGFRCYPLEKVIRVIDTASLPERMGFDPEILVRSSWAGIELRYVPVQVTYPEDGKSHFHYLSDNLEIAWMHARLLVGGLVRSPALLWRRLRS